MSVNNGSAKGAGFASGPFPKNHIELNITLSDIDILLNPDSSPNEDATKPVVVHISLSVPLNMDAPTHIGRMTVELKTDEILGFPQGIFEKNNPHEVKQTVESASGMPVSAGNVYQWDIPIHISHRTSPYERGIYGKCFHKVVVTLEWSGWMGWWKGGGSLVAEKPVFITASRPNPSAIVYTYSHQKQTIALGPLIVLVHSRQFSVGGYIRFVLSLQDMKPTIVLRGITVSLNQDTILISRQHENRVEQCPSEHFKVGTLNADELLSDHEWTLRLPDDRQIRPTSIQGSQSAIRHFHTLEFKLLYSERDEQDLRKYSAKWPIELASCGALWRSIKLPMYNEFDPSPVPQWKRDDWEPEKYPNIHMSQTVCACGQSMNTLLAWEKEGAEEQGIPTKLLLEDALIRAQRDLRRSQRSASVDPNQGYIIRERPRHHSQGPRQIASSDVRSEAYTNSREESSQDAYSYEDISTDEVERRRNKSARVVQ